jgi:hypothetical protein
MNLAPGDAVASLAVIDMGPPPVDLPDPKKKAAPPDTAGSADEAPAKAAAPSRAKATKDPNVKASRTSGAGRAPKA